MGDPELTDLLRRARVPKRSDDYWRDFPSGTTRRLHASLEGERTPVLLFRHRLAIWGVGFAIGCILIGFATGRWHAERAGRRYDIAEAQKLFSELSTIFPNQLEAVVLDGSTARLVLAEHAMQDKGAPIFVRICGAKGCHRVITFSGRVVSLNGQLCEVLLDMRGNVIVTGDRFAWSSSERVARPGGCDIEAALLSAL